MYHEQTQTFAQQLTWENKANLHFSLTTDEFFHMLQTWAGGAKSNLHFSLTTDEPFCAFLCRRITLSRSLTMQVYRTELLSNNAGVLHRVAL